MSTFLRVNDVAERLGLSRQYVYNAVRSGALRVHRFGRNIRIDPADLDKWIQGESHSVETESDSLSEADG